MFSSTSSSVSGSGNGGWLSSLSASTSTAAPANAQRKKPLRGSTFSVATNPEEMNQGSIEAAAVPQAVASRVGVLGWFNNSPSTNDGTGSVGTVEKRPVVDEPESQVEEVTVEPVCAVPDREEEMLERERQVESREKELEERRLMIDQRERELEVRLRELEERERVSKEEMQRREKELEKVTEWMDALKKEVNAGLSVERKKAEERELALEARVIKRVTELVEQKSKVSRWLNSIC